ncbi:MAG: hypothetical protein GWN30_20735, partial [Gammaproteobacteria bacterium]|nr:hypothetical protein [Gammaproteobacteria bacterium]
NWHGYVDGMLEAKKQGKNVVLIVYADWCSVCKRYSKMFFNNSVIANSDNVVLVRLNQDQDQRYLKKFSLDGKYVPRTYILDSNFKVQPSPFKSKKYDFYLPPGNEEYLVRLFKKLKI